MPNIKPERIQDYEILFAVRAGVTLMIPKTSILDDSTSATFRPVQDGSGDILLEASGRAAIIPDIRPEHMTEVMERGSMMIYELVNDEVVRCTPARLAR